MSLPSYSKYKDSAIEWLGEIPAHWDVRRLKFLLNEPLKYGANEAAIFDDPSWPRFIRITDVRSDGTLRDETFRSIAPESASGYRLEEGDILFARSGATVGKTFQYRSDWGIAAFAGYLIRARLMKSLNDRYYQLFFNSHPYWEWIRNIFIQSTIQNVSAEKYGSMIVPLPPLLEQDKIAAFLDRKTAEIDTLIARKRRLLDRLAEKRTALITRAVTKGLNPDAPMKDSGIQWLGEIPAHWDVLAIKQVFEFQNNRRIPIAAAERKSLERTYPYYGASGIIDYVDDYIFEEDLMLVAEDGANLLSRSTPLAFVARGKYWVNNHAHILKNRFGLLDYWEMLLSVCDFTPFITGSAQPKLTKDRLGAIAIPCPPQKEQSDILKLLGPSLERDELARVLCKKAIERLKEYRSALITNAVTGQIKVA